MKLQWAMSNKNSAPFAVLIQSLTHQHKQQTTQHVLGLSTNTIHSFRAPFFLSAKQKHQYRFV